MMAYLRDYMDGIWRRLHTSLLICWETIGGNEIFEMPRKDEDVIVQDIEVDRP